MREIRNGCTQKSFSRERKKWGCECDLALRTVSSETYVIGWKWEVHFSLLPDYMLSSLSNVRFFLLHLPLFTRYTLPTLLFSFLFFSFPFSPFGFLPPRPRTTITTSQAQTHTHNQLSLLSTLTLTTGFTASLLIFRKGYFPLNLSIIFPP